MDARIDGHDNPRMSRYTFPAFKNASTTRCLACYDLQWSLVDCRYLEPGADLSAAMAAALERLSGEGWQAEGGVEYGFVFIRRGNERRLLVLTPRDPHSTAEQAFSPFRPPEGGRSAP
jgi:hypothetical protein